MMVLKYSLPVLLVCCSFLSVRAQNIELQSLGLVVMQMENHNRYESARTGFSALKSEQYSRFEKMQALATDSELVQLAANHGNAVVRLYAYQALLQKGLFIPTQLQQKFEEDQTIVTTVIGCVHAKKTVAALVKTEQKPVLFKTLVFSNYNQGL